MATATNPPAPEPIPVSPTAKKLAAVPSPGTGPKRKQVAVANRADGGFFYWLGKLSLLAACVSAVAIGLALVMSSRAIALAAPQARDFKSYASAAPSVSRIYAADGTLLGEFAREWRKVVPYEKIPPHLVNA